MDLLLLNGSVPVMEKFYHTRKGFVLVPLCAGLDLALGMGELGVNLLYYPEILCEVVYEYYCGSCFEN